MRGLRATASAALLAWGLTWSVGALAAPTGHVEPRRPTPVTGKVSVDAPTAVAPPAVSTAVQVPAPVHLPAAPYDLQAPTHAQGAVVGAGAAVRPVAKPVMPAAQPKHTSGQAVASARHVSRETSHKAVPTTARSAKLAHQGDDAKVAGDAARQDRKKPSQALKRSVAHGASHGAGKGARAQAKAVRVAKVSAGAPKAMASAASTKAAKPAQTTKATQSRKATKAAHTAKAQASRAQVTGSASQVRAGHTEAAVRARKPAKGTGVAKAGAVPGHRRPHPHGA